MLQRSIQKQSLAARERLPPQGVWGSHLVSRFSDEEKWTQNGLGDSIRSYS